MPEFRTQFTEPFTAVGVDFAGPLKYKLERYEEPENCPYNGKCYIALFTCAVTRAVYLKLCRSGTFDEFQRVFKEFVSRRGTPRLIVSDNAKTFISTAEWLKTLKIDQEFQNYLSKEGIEWKFNLSRAPWWGGFFERLIGIMKRALSKSIGRGYLSFHELEGVLYDVESFLNNRPLCYQGEDFEKPALTPNTFLIGNCPHSLEEDIDKLDEHTDLTKRLTFLQRCKTELRQRWQNEYLHALQERHNVRVEGGNHLPGIGEIVLVKEDVKDRAQWKIARITKELKGKDDILRAYELKLGNGWTIQRPIQLICPLEIKSEITTLPTITKETTIEKRPTRQAKDDAKAKIIAIADADQYID